MLQVSWSVLIVTGTTQRVYEAQCVQVLHVCVCTCACTQVIIQSGQPPTVLQQLCSLPFPYFSDASLTNILFPTLVSCCYLVDRNREILQQELSCALLANFIEVSLNITHSMQMCLQVLPRNTMLALSLIHI